MRMVWRLLLLFFSLHFQAEYLGELSANPATPLAPAMFSR